jgi:hypothetical protein
MTRAELEAVIAADQSIASYLEADEITAACNEAAKETGWAFPVSGDFKELWIERRSKRNCYMALWTQSARKFKVEQLSLNQRFDHYGKIIAKMDLDFKDVQEERPDLFTNVESYKAFGDVAAPGFVYDITGKDITRFFGN